MIKSNGTTLKTRKIVFLTGTRADFGKLKPLIRAINQTQGFECHIFVTGMHLFAKYGSTVREVFKEGFKNIHTFINQVEGESMDLILANTITGLARFVGEHQPDMIVVHGDRVEALAGAIVGALQNIFVAHIEGGEVSGTVDGLIRHSVSKLSHLHFVSNTESANRLKQLGESPATIHVIGSPDIDVMLSSQIGSLEKVKKHYEIEFDAYSIVLFHPVTTEIEQIECQVNEMVSALIKSRLKYIVIYPNNDTGSKQILSSYETLQGNTNFKIFPSLRFEWFLTLLKHAKFIIGNSSAGIREAPVYAIPTINIGTRQAERFKNKSIIDAGSSGDEILKAINQALQMEGLEPCLHFGEGNSAARFKDALSNEALWLIKKQKQFYDFPGLA